MKYSISEVAEIMGVPASTIRFYDKEGLLPNIKRESGKRVFTDDDFKWLKVKFVNMLNLQKKVIVL